MSLSPATIALILKGAAIPPTINGALCAFFGVAFGLPNTRKPALVTGQAHTETLDSQLRYLGCLSMGYGIALWWAANDVTARRNVVGILGAAMFAGGLARLRSALGNGFAAARMVYIAMWAEILGGAGMALWGR